MWTVRDSTLESEIHTLRTHTPGDKTSRLRTRQKIQDKDNGKTQCRTMPNTPPSHKRVNPKENTTRKRRSSHAFPGATSTTKRGYDYTQHEDCVFATLKMFRSKSVIPTKIFVPFFVQVPVWWSATTRLSGMICDRCARRKQSVPHRL